MNHEDCKALEAAANRQLCSQGKVISYDRLVKFAQNSGYSYNDQVKENLCYLFS
jgi:hypothetical protein